MAPVRGPAAVITVATWNVLHRVHADNYEEPVAAAWPDEAARIAAVTAFLAARDEDIIALQEVSGDQLASLREVFPSLHAMSYPRRPTIRRGTPQLRDATEHLVVIGRGERGAADAFDGDPGKGFVAVHLGSALVVCTHVGFGPARIPQLHRLAALASGPAVVLGDFNADRDTIAAGLGPAFTLAGFAPGAPPTRPGARSPYIDHIAVHGATVSAATVVDVGGLSDHNLVAAAIET